MLQQFELLKVKPLQAAPLLVPHPDTHGDVYVGPSYISVARSSQLSSVTSVAARSSRSEESVTGMVPPFVEMRSVPTDNARDDFGINNFRGSSGR
jgi:hypothetical protein